MCEVLSRKKCSPFSPLIELLLFGQTISFDVVAFDFCVVFRNKSSFLKKDWLLGEVLMYTVEQGNTIFLVTDTMER